jgi:hypothetical protein
MDFLSHSRNHRLRDVTSFDPASIKVWGQPTIQDAEISFSVSYHLAWLSALFTKPVNDAINGCGSIFRKDRTNMYRIEIRCICNILDSFLDGLHKQRHIEPLQSRASLLATEV